MLLNCNIADDLEWSVTSEQRVAIAVFAASCVACQITSEGHAETERFKQCPVLTMTAHRLCLMVVCVNYSWLMSCKVNWLMQHDM